VAVIEIPTPDAQPLPIASSSDLEVGEWVVAIGSPFGLRSTLTVGVVSATGRTSIGINDYEDFIQTDAAINPGNSGGPLVNLDGKVVGMNTAIFSRSGGYMGIGFAIPIDLATSIAGQLMDSGQVTRGYLGVAIQPLTQELAESFGIDRTQGILVAQVSGDSPAEAAGIAQGDVIVSYRGEPVEDTGDFRNRVAIGGQLSFSRRKRIPLQDERDDVGVGLDGKRAGAFGWHQLLNARRQLADLHVAPEKEKALAHKARSGVVATKIVAVTRGAGLLVRRTAAPGLSLGVDAVPHGTAARRLILRGAIGREQ
jgi:serine protease Do